MRRMGFSLARVYMLNAGRAHGGKKMPPQLNLHGQPSQCEVNEVSLSHANLMSFSRPLLFGGS